MSSLAEFLTDVHHRTSSQNVVADGLFHALLIATVSLGVDVYTSLAEAQSSYPKLAAHHNSSILSLQACQITPDLPSLVCNVSCGHSCPFLPPPPFCHLAFFFILYISCLILAFVVCNRSFATATSGLACAVMWPVGLAKIHGHFCRERFQKLFTLNLGLYS